MVLKFFTENKLFYFSKRELRAGTARNVVKGSPVQSLVMKHRSKSTLETLEQLLISSKVNIKHNRTTSWSSFLTQLSELNIFWMIVSTLLLSLNTLHYCVLLCTALYWHAMFRKQAYIQSSPKNKGKTVSRSFFSYIGTIASKFIWVEYKPVL